MKEFHQPTVEVVELDVGAGILYNSTCPEYNFDCLVECSCEKVCTGAATCIVQG